MTTYHVYGHICGERISVRVTASNGADAIKDVARPFLPTFGKKTWKAERKQWYADHVRLNAKQVAGESAPVPVDLCNPSST